MPGMDLVILLLAILIVVLLVRGPKTLPRLGESLGDAIRSVRRAANERSDTTGTGTDTTPDGEERRLP
jgi:TatA/E family protein of Tat protein translocase